MIERHRAEGGLFAGDDVTDEDVFTRAAREDVIGVRIRHSTRSRAQYYVKSQCEVDKVLQLLLDARPGAGRLARSA